jgi:hypothetical protein
MYVPEKCIETFWDSSLGIKTGYGLDGPRLIPGRDKVFLFFIASKLSLGPTKPPIQWVPFAIPRK